MRRHFTPRRFATLITPIFSQLSPLRQIADSCHFAISRHDASAITPLLIAADIASWLMIRRFLSPLHLHFAIFCCHMILFSPLAAIMLSPLLLRFSPQIFADFRLRCLPPFSLASCQAIIARHFPLMLMPLRTPLFHYYAIWPALSLTMPASFRYYYAIS